MSFNLNLEDPYLIHNYIFISTTLNIPKLKSPRVASETKLIYVMVRLTALIY